MKKLIFTLLMLCFGYSAMFAQTAKRIAFLHDPTTPVAQSGLMANLRTAGYTVDSFYKGDAGVFDYVALGGYDLVIISKGVTSADFVDSTAWDTIKVPVFITSVQATRNTRMHLLNTANVIGPDDMTLWSVDQITDALPIANSDGTTYDEVFSGVTTGGPFPFYKWAYIYPDYYYSDWKFDKLTGKLLVVLPDTASYGGGAILMARWAPGTVPYKGAGVHAGWVSYMDIGADDNASPENFNYDNYTSASLKLFMNEVVFLISQKKVAKRIAFLTDPTNLGDFGTTPAEQVGLEAALRAEGYTVDVSYTPFDTIALAGYDLIIVSRNVSGSDFTEYQMWNRIPKPILILSPIVRDVRMRLMNGQPVIPADSALVDPNLITDAVPVINKDGTTYDSVFNNVSKNGAAFPYFKGMYCYVDYYMSDFNLDANTGKPLVVLADNATQGGAGSMTMVRWEAGTQAYAGTGILAGRRTYMEIGTNDLTAAGHYNLDNYTANSLTLFLNEVKFLMGIPIPKWINTGVNELKNTSQFNVYPTPSTNGNFIIEIKDAKAKSANVLIYTITGQQVYAKDFKMSGNISINSGLNKGMYLMVVNVDGNKLTRKIVIN